MNTTSNEGGSLSCCKSGHDRHRVYKGRDSRGRFVSKVIHQSDIPQQCYLCKHGTHHKCVQPEECGCDCQDFIEDIIIEQQ